MHVLSAAELLDIWEQALAQPPVQQALTLLGAAYPEMPPDTLAALSMGQRDTLLLSLRERIFGSQLISLAICPQCGDRLELSFNIADIRTDSDIEPGETYSLASGDYEVSFRLPNSLDLIALMPQVDSNEPRKQLLKRCLLTVQRQGETLESKDTPTEVMGAIVERMSQVDPQAEVNLDLTCPSCKHQWLATFDILSFLWREIDTWAYRILREVHCLASVYGWSERDILAMSSWRRQFYLEMISG